MGKKKEEDDILDVCKYYKDSKLYSMIKDRVELLMESSADRDAMHDYLLESAENYYQNDPMHMLGFLNLLKRIGGNPYSSELQLKNGSNE